MYDNVSVRFNAKIKPVKPINDEMTLCKCYVMALGRNTNRSNISKCAADDALPTLFNIPVVGRIYADDEGNLHMGGHDYNIVKNEKGKYVFKSLTVPYGTVPYQENATYEEVVEPNGTKSTYLVADIILWTGRYPELLNAAYNEEVFFNQSMELKPLKTEVKDGYTDIQKYQYKALCLLGKDDDPEFNVNPCFPSARVEPYDFSLNDKWDELFEEFKNKLGECYSEKRSLEKGGNETMDFSKFNEILNEFGIEKIEDVAFEVTEDMSVEEFREKLANSITANTANEEVETATVFEEENEEVTEANETANENVVTTSEPETTVEENTFEPEFALNMNKKISLFEKVLEDFRVCVLGHYEWFGFTDYDDQYLYCRYTIEKAGQALKTGFCRFNYKEVDLAVEVDKSTFTEVSIMWLTQEEAVKLDKERHEYAELVEFKEKQLEENKRREYSAIVAEFSNLEEVAEYKEVVGNMLSFESGEALKEKLFAIRGKTGIYKESKVPVDEVRIPVNFSNNEGNQSKEYMFFSKYYPEAIKK